MFIRVAKNRFFSSPGSSLLRKRTTFVQAVEKRSRLRIYGYVHIRNSYLCASAMAHRVR